MKFSLLFVGLMLATGLLAQPANFPRNGVYDLREDHYAFVNARICTAPGKVLEQATLLIKGGKVQAVGSQVKVPKDAVLIDLKGKYIYPAFIETFAQYGLPKAQAAGKPSEQYPQMLSNKEGAYAWNEALKPELEAAALFQPEEKAAEKWRKMGFGAVLSHQQDGLARGSGSLVFTGSETAHEMLLKARAASFFSFNKGISTQAYPSSLMGVIALLRQTHYDAAWYAKEGKNQSYDRSLEAWNNLHDLPAIFECNHRLNVLRADKIGDEFGRQYLFKGAGDEYLRLEAMKETKGTFILPLNFPKAYDVADPYDMQQLALEQMKHWELAPSNPARMAQAQIPFVFTTEGLEADASLFAQLRQAYQAGLKEADLLHALTLGPAKILGVEKELGSLEPGKWANFIITSGHLLQEETQIQETWVKGKGYVFQSVLLADLSGTYDLQWANNRHRLDVKAKGSKWEAKLWMQGDSSKKQKLELNLEIPNRLSLSFSLPKDSSDKNATPFRLTGMVAQNQDTWQGQGQDSLGQWFSWTATRLQGPKPDSLKLPTLDSSSQGPIYYPANGYGFLAEELPNQDEVLFQNATVWTGESQGILEQTDVLVQKGKIAKIGKGLKASGTALVVDAKGKHLTAGIIDEHSHIAINAGVNEGTQESSAEVRIGDVLNSEDVNIYRQLAGGVTAVQLLHGSANPIGGQSALIKLRLGQLPEALKVQDAPAFIKFALGENVKQSNWGDNARIRFPQTRMGVEQVYEDYFTRAKEYGEQRKKHGDKTRRDLDLETVQEIIEGRRFITCHSYVQSEITMLMRVAERHNFRVNTFTHILEGYKIADKMKAHGVGASTFSDWWAYKMEVMDAIPHNAKILDEMGVVTAINSDDAEMGRRLNQEAAKSVKYAGMAEARAWNLVTLNPAKLLRVDKHMGSIKEGKDADLVLWTDNPLSVYARPERTYVDGRCLFSLERDALLRQRIAKERSRLVAKMLAAKAKGEKTQPVTHQHQHHYHCNDLHNGW